MPRADGIATAQTLTIWLPKFGCTAVLTVELYASQLAPMACVEMDGNATFANAIDLVAQVNIPTSNTVVYILGNKIGQVYSQQLHARLGPVALLLWGDVLWDVAMQQGLTAAFVFYIISHVPGLKHRGQITPKRKHRLVFPGG